MFNKRRIYLDWAASAPVSERAARVFAEALRAYGNPSALHTEARQAKEVLEAARTTIARLTEVKTDGVVFTSGATEANALGILGAVRAKGVRGAHVLYHPAQHASVIGAIEMLKSEGAETEELQLANLTSQLRAETVLVTLDAVCGETGTRYDTLAVRRLLDEHAQKGGQKILFHVDASQAALTEQLTLAHLGADMMTLDAQKVGAVRGIGALILRQGITLEPLMRGGGQEGRRRPGTESPALASAFATALTEVQEGRMKFRERSERMREALLQNISGISNLVVNETEMKVPHILNVSLLGRDTDYAVMLLDKEGFAASTKSACETDEEGSRAVQILTSDSARATSTLRVSWGPTTSERDLASFAEALVRTVRFLDENAI
ncbi:MAG: Cysteine desulfurase [Parcubacteria group bacterium]|nr:Cysteine desulfurase [Parcubacteria group bacterium]